MARPKVYTSETQPYSLTIRIPRELYNQMVRYTGTKDRYRSDAMIEGLTLWLERKATSEPFSHYGNNPVMRELNTPAHLLDDGIPFDDERWPMPTPDNAAAEGKLSDNNMSTGAGAARRRNREGQATISAHVADTVTDTGGQAGAMMGTAPETSHVTDTVTDTVGVTDTVTVAGHALEPFDTTKFYLGKLCPKGHDYYGTGHSLLRKHNQRCRECENEAKRARYRAKRQPQPVAG